MTKEFGSRREVIKKLTCEECPIRRSNESVKLMAMPLLECLRDGDANIDDIQEQVGESETDKNNISKCGRMILAGDCGRYVEEPDFGYYITEKRSGEWE